ncbi:MAG: hypothetical protein MJY59_05705 [Bacteroidaceae bacterium]|nr:hypothetical protein [Bacteroidaceae bacterium]
MTERDYQNTDWQHGNKVRLTNGKEYFVMRQKKRYLLLLSEEYMAYFVADHRIIDCRTSDYVGHTNPKNLQKSEV